MFPKRRMIQSPLPAPDKQVTNSVRGTEVSFTVLRRGPGPAACRAIFSPVAETIH